MDLYGHYLLFVANDEIEVKHFERPIPHSFQLLDLLSSKVMHGYG